MLVMFGSYGLARDIWTGQRRWLLLGIFQPVLSVFIIYTDYITLAEALDNDAIDVATEDDLERTLEKSMADRLSAYGGIALDVLVVVLCFWLSGASLKLRRAYRGLASSDEPWLLQVLTAVGHGHEHAPAGCAASFKGLRSPTLPYCSVASPPSVAACVGAPPPSPAYVSLGPPLLSPHAAGVGAAGAGASPHADGTTRPPMWGGRSRPPTLRELRPPPAQNRGAGQRGGGRSVGPEPATGRSCSADPPASADGAAAGAGGVAAAGTSGLRPHQPQPQQPAHAAPQSSRIGRASQELM